MQRPAAPDLTPDAILAASLAAAASAAAFASTLASWGFVGDARTVARSAGYGLRRADAILAGIDARESRAALSRPGGGREQSPRP